MDTTSAHHWPWDVLGIAANADACTVRRAYARLLKQRRPEEDAEAFQRLRYAYESALQMVGSDAEKRAPAPCSLTPHETLPREPDAFEIAVQLWQGFVAQPDQLESRGALEDLFAAVINLATRDELEWQALCHCLNQHATASLRTNLSAVLGWRDNAAHLRQRNAAIANLALNRVFADEDYDTLRLRFTNALDLLEGPPPTSLPAGARALLRAGARTEMEQLLTALGRYHPNVVRLRLDADKVEFWTRCLTPSGKTKHSRDFPEFVLTRGDT